jgi:hypothetical protein
MWYSVRNAGKDRLGPVNGRTKRDEKCETQTEKDEPEMYTVRVQVGCLESKDVAADLSGRQQELFCAGYDQSNRKSDGRPLSLPARKQTSVILREPGKGCHGEYRTRNEWKCDEHNGVAQSEKEE